jgi:hypothetical protein
MTRVQKRDLGHRITFVIVHAAFKDDDVQVARFPKTT